jgi:hypothetical protein
VYSSVKFVMVVTCLTEIARKIDEKEEARIDNLVDELFSGKEIDQVELFGNETIPKMLKETPLSYFNSFYGVYDKLPINCLLYPKIIIYVCPYCPCVSNTSLIKPFLERGIVLPVLSYPLKSYKPEFVNLVLTPMFVTSSN